MDIEDKSKTKESILNIVLKTSLELLLGSAFISSSSLFVKLFSSCLIILLFLVTMKKRDYFSLLLQLFVCNLFVLGPEYGGLFNWLFILALVAFFVIKNDKVFYIKSSFTSPVKWCLSLLLFIQTISVILGNDFDWSKKLIAIASFFILIVIFYFLSCIPTTEGDYTRFVIVICIFFIYMFFVALNQKLQWVPFNYPFFPNNERYTEFQFDIIRSSGTLSNYEAYAEYSLSVIALLLPGILSGSIKNISPSLFYLCLITVFLGVFAIVLTATRSSILLAPLMLVLILFNIKKIKSKVLIAMVLTIVITVTFNSQYHFIDFSVFTKRSADVNLSRMSLSSIISGEDINRAPLFHLGMENISKNGGLIGGGYFNSPIEYHNVHFKSYVEDYADYHNLYLSLPVIWGFIGAIMFLYIMFSLCVRGLRLYKKMNRSTSLSADLLLGFNTLFVLFAINQIKIQFNRNVNYFLIMLIFMALYSTLIKQIANKIISPTSLFDFNKVNKTSLL